MEIQDKLRTIDTLTQTISRIYNLRPDTADIATRQLNIVIQGLTVDFSHGEVSYKTELKKDTFSVEELKEQGIPVYTDKKLSAPSDVSVVVKPSDIPEALKSK